MEGGEVYDLIGDKYPLEEQNDALYNEIINISKDIDEILEKKPENVFDFKDILASGDKTLSRPFLFTGFYM
jgi:hypothetical protein